jgi:hypothetical protein
MHMRYKLMAASWCWQQRIADHHVDNQQAEQARVPHQR